MHLHVLALRISNPDEWKAAKRSIQQRDVRGINDPPRGRLSCDGQRRCERCQSNDNVGTREVSFEMESGNWRPEPYAALAFAPAAANFLAI